MQKRDLPERIPARPARAPFSERYLSQASHMKINCYTYEPFHEKTNIMESAEANPDRDTPS